MGTQGLHAALVLVVPDPKCFIIGTAYYEPSSWMKQYATHPVVMSHLKKHSWLLINALITRLVVFNLFPHQSHEADADAHIPQFNCFISGSRQKEGTRLSTFLALQ